VLPFYLSFHSPVDLKATTNTGYPMKFERMTDRWSPVYVEEKSNIFARVLGVAFGLAMVFMLAFAILGG